jgi:DNA-binding beta-propeller fold protein YncE
MQAEHAADPGGIGDRRSSVRAALSIDMRGRVCYFSHNMNAKIAYRAASTAAAVILMCLACAPVTISPETSDPGTIWVADEGSGRIVKVNESCTAIVATSPDLGRPVAVVFDPYKGYCWAADADGGRIFRLTSRGVVEKTLYGFGEPVSLSYFPKEDAVWVADRARGTVYKLSALGNIRAQIGGLKEPTAVAVDTRRGEVYIACANKIVRCDRWAQPIYNFYGFKNPQSLAFDAGYGFLWIADTGNGRVVKITPSGQVVAESQALANPTSVAVNPRTGFCFAADAEAGKIVSLKGNGTVRWTNDDYRRPNALAANSSDMSLWVADGYGFVVAKLKGSTGDVVDDKPLPGFANAVALSPDPGLR